jgi:hypothetical protein
MKRSKNETGELQITTLDQVEIHNPLLVLRSFTEDFSLASTRQLIETMRDVCITTENVFFGKAVTREDLLHVTRHIIRFFEAAYLYLARPQSEKGMLVVHDSFVQKQTTPFQLYQIMERSIRSRRGIPYTYPCLIISGKWMEKAGFHVRDEVSIVHEHQKILITVHREWDAENSDFKKRA